MENIIGDYNKILNIQNLNGNLIINGYEHKNTEPCVLFLRIDRKLDNIYRMNLELKTHYTSGSVTQEQELVLDSKFFDTLTRFENMRSKKPNARKAEEVPNSHHGLMVEEVLGEEIYARFFTGEIRVKFEEFFDLLCKSKISDLTLVISSSSSDILNIPFELIKDKRFFSLERDNFKIVRTVEKSLGDFNIKGIESLAPPLRVLFVTSLPESLDDNERFLQLEREQERFIEVLSDLITGQDKKILVDFIEIASLDEIRKTLEKGRHDILHISGHGGHSDGCGVLYLEDEQGIVQVVTGEKLADAVGANSSLKLVVLSACETARAEDSGVAGALMHKGIPAVVAMRYPVSDPVATLFTSHFYEGICKGENFKLSLYRARKAVFEFCNEQRKDDPLLSAEWFTPFVYLNQNIDVLVDYRKPPQDTAYYYKKPEHFLRGGKYVGEGFIGRHKEIIRLTGLFRNGKNAVCIHGLGGLGKTTLALRFADNFEGKEYEIIQYVGQVTEEKVLSKILQKARKKMGDEIVELLNVPDMSPIEKLQFLIENYMRKEKLIIIFDNFEDNQKSGEGYTLEISSDSLGEFLNYLCKNLARTNYVLFTTRYRFSQPKVEFISMGEMNFPDTFKFLNRLPHLSKLDYGEIEEIRSKLGGHPRALEMLEGLLDADNTTWKDVSGRFNDVVKDIDIEGNKAILFDMLWGRLSKRQRDVLKQASVFRIVMPVSVLATVVGMGVDEVRADVDYMCRLSLVYYEGHEFFVHRLTAGYVVNTVDGEDERKGLHLKAAGYYVGGMEGDKSQKFLQDVLEARHHYIQAMEYDEAVKVTGWLDDLRDRGFADMLLGLYSEIVGMGVSDKSRSALLHHIGIICQHKGEYERSLEYYKKSLEIKERIGDIKGIGTSYHNIGMIYEAKGEYERSLEYYTKSLEIFERIEDIKGIGSSYHNIGIIYQYKGEYERALKYYKKSLEIAERLGSIKGIGESYHNIGMIYQHEGEYEGALEYYTKSLEIFERIEDIKGIGYSYHNIGMIYEYKGEYERALEYCKKSLEIFERIGDIKGIGSSYHQIGMIYQYKGENESALEYYTKSLEITKRIGDIKRTGESYGQIGVLFQARGDYPTALRCTLNAYSIFSKLGVLQVNISINVINELKTQMSEDEFNAVFSECGLDPATVVGDEEGLTLERLTVDIVNAATDEKKETLANFLENIIAQINNKRLKPYFTMLKAYLSGEDYTAYKDKVSQELYDLFEGCLNRDSQD